MRCAKDERQTAFCLDECSFVVAPYIVRGWFERGKPAVVKTNYTREKFHAMGVMNGRHEHYSFYDKINSINVLDFVKRLQKRYPRLLIFLDGTPWHRTKKFTDWYKAHKVRLVRFPGYSPELNPIEQSWKTVKHSTANTYYQNKHKYKKAVKHATRQKNLTKMFQYFNY
ncbi:MAG: IS630 family transposase [Candidatus Altiarchaeota archaeon]|nr:IS630 family transposase [Candidatus Altiarchaeota archaeon]